MGGKGCGYPISPHVSKSRPGIMLAGWKQVRARSRRTHMRFVRTFAVVLASAAYSCPVCHTQTGEQVRAGIFNRGFGLNLVAIALPFPVFACIVGWIYFGKPLTP